MSMTSSPCSTSPADDMKNENFDYVPMQATIQRLRSSSPGSVMGTSPSTSMGMMNSPYGSPASHMQHQEQQQSGNYMMSGNPLETASRMKMQHLRRGEEHVVWLTSMETPRSCILLYGNAEARPFNLATAPVLNFTEGSVVGNLGAPPRASIQRPATSEKSEASSSNTLANSTVGAADSKWRRVKRENSLRKDIHLYNKIVLSGPADYIVLTASDVRDNASGASDRLHWAKIFGLESLQDVCGRLSSSLSTAYDTLRFVLERVEIESKNEHCDQRLKIDSLREALRQKHPVMTKDKQSTSTSSGSTANTHRASSTSSQPEQPEAINAGGQCSSVVSLPSVVLSMPQPVQSREGNTSVTSSGLPSLPLREKT
ncbi:uncharacterized protein KRP23_1560 [Phytophthora ramorum]|uniref:uncharacterized protein n=1 Tax=Phytophthora ramorum TaxID=164328 RepID=UPI0030A81B81|nr:hypothetical protein KRP23_1560 [Phytophthora ramorum]